MAGITPPAVGFVFPHAKTPPEEHYGPRTEKSPAIRQEHYGHCEDFLRQLPPALVDRFTAIMDEQLNLLPLDFQESFTDGFRLGALLVLDILHPCR